MMPEKIKSKQLQFEQNSFDILRYWAAFSVMLLHYTGYARMLSDQARPFMEGLRYVVNFFPGVVVLFAMSGYLVSASMDRAKSRKEYFKKRVFRLYPELWLCTLVNLIVLLVLAADQLDSGIWVWCVTQVFGIANTPDCLKNFGTGSVNGALWTIFTEIQLYVVLGLIYPWLKKRTHIQWWLLIFAAAAVNFGCGYFADSMGGIAAKLLERTFIPYFLWFLIGCYCYAKQDMLPGILKKKFVPCVLIYGIFRVGGWVTAGYYTDIVTGILCPFLVIGAGYWLSAKRLRFDCTYGIFLYHWIVLNVIVHFDLLNRVNWLGSMALYVGLTMILADGSTKIRNLMEKKNFGKSKIRSKKHRLWLYR